MSDIDVGDRVTWTVPRGKFLAGTDRLGTVEYTGPIRARVDDDDPKVLWTWLLYKNELTKVDE